MSWIYKMQNKIYTVYTQTLPRADDGQSATYPWLNVNQELYETASIALATLGMKWSIALDTQ